MCLSGHILLSGFPWLCSTRQNGRRTLLLTRNLRLQNYPRGQRLVSRFFLYSQSDRPAFGRLWALDEGGVHCWRNKPKRIDEGLSINKYAVNTNHTFAEQKALRYEISRPAPYNENHKATITAICINWSARNVESEF